MGLALTICRFSVRLFGPFSISESGGSLIMPAGRKARAILAFCLCAAPGAVRRERLIDLLWGDRAEEQARASLRQALYELRALSGGERPLLAVGRSDVKVDAGQVTSDLDGLREAVAGDDANRLLDLLGASPDEPFADLDGISLEFDDWVAAERSRLQEARRTLALPFIEKRLDAQPDVARRLASALLVADPVDELAARLAMDANERLGDTDSARRIFARLANSLRTQLDVQPSRATMELQARIGRSSGSLTSQASMYRPLPVHDEQKPSTQSSRRRRTYLLPTGVLVLILAALGALYVPRPWSSAGMQKALLVAPLRTKPSDARAEIFRQSLSNDLNRLVVGSDTSLEFADQADAGARSTADYVLSGEAQSDRDLLSATIRLLDRKKGIILWSRTFSGAAQDSESLRQQLASKTADVLVCALGSRAKPPEGIDLGTLQLYLAGCENRHTDWPSARRYFGQVVQRRPDFARARAMYADALRLNIGYFDTLVPAERARIGQEAIKQAKLALAQDPHAGPAYNVLACSRDVDDWSRVEALLARATKADPTSSELETSYGVILGNQGRDREGIPHIERAAELDPFSAIAGSNLAEAKAYGGRVDEALRLLDRARQYWPSEFYTSLTRFEVTARFGDPAEALAMLDHPQRNPGYVPRMPALWRLMIAARLKPTRQSTDAAAALAIRMAKNGSTQDQLEILQDLVALGKLDAAYDLAMRLPKWSTNWGFVWFRGFMAPFRADPRFIAFADRQGLLAYWRRTGHWPDFCRDEKLPYRCA